MLSRLETTFRQNLRQNLHSSPFSNWVVPATQQFSSVAASKTRPIASCSHWVPENRRFASTNTARAPAVEGNSQVPRFIRRQALQKATRKGKDVASTDGKGEIKLLDPYILAKRLRNLCENGKLDDAVAMLKNSPRDAMNAPVWNTMIWETMKKRRFQLAYRLYVDMKRRGFSPTTRTYQTMLTGLSKIEQWSSHAQQLSNAKLLYDAFLRHITSLKKHDPDSPDISVAPLTAYIKILGDNGQYQEIFDVFHALDSDGPFSADAQIYTAMFQAIANMRHALSRKGITAPDSWDSKVAADARELWVQLTRASKKGPAPLADAFTTTTAISALSKGSKQDQDLAFSILEEYFGLSKDLSRPAARSGHLVLGPATLGAALKLCNHAGEYSTCPQFLQQVKERPAADGGLSIIDRPHMEEILKARYQMPDSNGLGQSSLQFLEWMLQQERSGHGGQIRPGISTYNLVLSACWKSSDWPSTAKTFELMTGYTARDFQHPLLSDTPAPKRSPRGQNLTPSAEGMSAMMRTALSTRQLRYIQQCLRMLQHIGIEHIRVDSASNNQKLKKDTKNNLFYGSKLASAVTESVKLLTAYKDESVPTELAKWRAFAANFREVFGQSNGRDGYVPTSLKEEGSKSFKPRNRL